jgi:hypothetical protein
VNFLKQLESIKSKDDLHKWVDSLPDDVELKGLVLVDETKPEDAGCCFTYRSIGPITVAESVYMTESYKHFVIFGDNDAAT